MTKKCLMVETIDKRRFFTHQRNYPQLIEFGRAFGAEISIVEVDSPTIMDLVSLAPALCDTSYGVKNLPDLEVLEVKLPRQKRNRTKLLKQASTVKQWIKDQLLAGKVVQLKEITSHFAHYGLSMQCFCNHLANVKKEMSKNGHEIVRVKHGVYKLVSD